MNATTRGSKEQPYKSVPYLISQLGAGQTGCLTAGSSFNSAIGEFVISASDGTEDEPVTVRSADPGNPARIYAAIQLNPNADDIVFSNLNFTGSPGSDKSVMIVIDGADGIEFRDNDITWTRGHCMAVGKVKSNVQFAQQATDSSDRFVLDGNRLHDCGKDTTVTRSDSGVHGLYVQYTNGARITNNYIYDIKNRGIQLYPDSRESLVANNAIDGNGTGINIGTESTLGHSTFDNEIRDNIVSNSTLRALTDPNWPQGDTDQIFGNGTGFGGPPRAPNDEPTYGNVVTHNCLYTASGKNNLGGWGYSQSGNIFKDPMYVDRAGGNFTLAPNSPCAGLGPQGADDDEPRPASCAEATRSSAGVGLVNRTLTGTSGDDVIVGTADDDTINGLAGNDLICGGGGFDTIRGHLGDDTMDAGAGGGAAEYGPAGAGVVIDLSAGSASGEGTDELASFSEVYGSEFDDEITTAASTQIVAGKGGNDTITAGDSTKQVVGCGAGSDELVADSLDAVDPDCESVDRGEPPEVEIVGIRITRPSKVVVTFTADTSSTGPLRARCKLDGAGFRLCASPKTYTRVANGRHTVRIEVTDTFGRSATTRRGFSL